MADSDFRVIATNRKARFEYEIGDRFEAGIALKGTEIKSIRAGAVSLAEGYAALRNGELWLLDVHIAPYEQAGRGSHDPRRSRKLLLHRRELGKIRKATQERGFTIVPLRMYLKGHFAKVEIGLAKGKRQYDKRRAIADRDTQRRVDRELKEYKRG